MNKEEILERMYNDFTNIFLPKISEGLTITKDYFFDLFGRYAHYLLIADIIGLILSIVGISVLSIILYYTLKYIAKGDDDTSEFIPILLLFVIIPLLLALMFTISGAYTKAKNIVKDIYIPEVRIYEELIKYKNQPTCAVN